MRATVRIALLGLAITIVAGMAFAQQNRCADCHFANQSPNPQAAARTYGWESHLRDWDLSAHSRAGIGCERCHGGDASTFESFRAHRGLLHPSKAASPLNRANIPTTCGTCHAGPFVAFQKSRHYAVLRDGNRAVPTCVTCHGDAGENRPSPKALENHCRSCHATGRPGGHAEYPALGRRMLEGVRDARASLKEARALVARVTDPVRRATLEAAAQQIDVPLTQATQAGHAFVYDDLDERLATARRRLDALFEQLVFVSDPHRRAMR
jgi:hypothetical protein